MNIRQETENCKPFRQIPSCLAEIAKEELSRRACNSSSVSETLRAVTAESLTAGFLGAKIVKKDGSKLLLCDKSRSPLEYEDCPSRVPLHLRANPRPPKKPAPKRGKYPQIFKPLFGYDKTAEFPNAILKWQLKKWLNNETWFHKQVGEISKCFPANRKGSPRYSMQKVLEIKDRAALMEKTWKHSYFITLTQSPDCWGKSFSEEWKEGQKAVNRFCKEMQRRIGGDYICVRESTVKGHVHYHLVFYCDMAADGHGEKYVWAHGVAVLESGGIKDVVLDLWDSWRGFSEVQPITEGDSASYCVKYVGKNETAQLHKLADKRKWSKKDRKAAQSFLLPLAFGLRTFSTSSTPKLLARSRSVLGDSEFMLAENALSENALVRKIVAEIFSERTESLKILSQVQFGDWRERGAERPRSGLLDLACINFPAKCRASLRILNVRDVPQEIKDNPGLTPLELRQKAKEMRKKARPIGCGGCAWSHIWREIIYQNSEWFRIPLLNRTKEEIAAIVDLTCDSRFRPIGYDVFQVDCRVLACLFPWWRYAHTLAHRAAIKRIARRDYHGFAKPQTGLTRWQEMFLEEN